MNISLRTPFTKKTPPPSPAPERAPHVALVPPPPAPPSRSRALTAAEVEAFGAELDQLRAEVIATVGEREATYIRRVHAFVRYTEIGGRTLLFAGWLPPAFVLGTGLLSVSKIVDNMELGHNVMHGQYNFLNDPEYRGDTFEWDTACPGDAWRHSHNYLHHNFTNILGKDRDLGYGVLSHRREGWSSHLKRPISASAGSGRACTRCCARHCAYQGMVSEPRAPKPLNTHNAVLSSAWPING